MPASGDQSRSAHAMRPRSRASQQPFRKRVSNVVEVDKWFSSLPSCHGPSGWSSPSCPLPSCRSWCSASCTSRRWWNRVFSTSTSHNWGTWTRPSGHRRSVLWCDPVPGPHRRGPTSPSARTQAGVSVPLTANRQGQRPPSETACRSIGPRRRVEIRLDSGEVLRRRMGRAARHPAA